MKLKQHLIALSIVSGLTLIWAITESGYYFTDAHLEWPEKSEYSWYSSLQNSLAIWCPWILLTPFIMMVNRRFPFRKGEIKKALLVHLLACLVFGTLKTMMESLALTQLFGIPVTLVSVGLVGYAAFIYWFFPAAYTGFMYFVRYREREMKVARLETQLAQAKLEALKIPLRPHFFFNTLHAVSTLIQCDAKAANKMINRLSELLRFSLDNLDRQEVTMEQEIDFLNRYLDIERIRFGDQLQVELDIDEQVEGALVPTLFLQPIVENAVNHGIDPTASDSWIRLSASRRNGELCIDVCDNGPGLADDTVPDNGGIGLKNTRARLAQLYGPKGAIHLTSPEKGGLKVRITLPFHTLPEQNGTEGMK